MKFIDLTGVGNSGKSAVGQILSEIRGIWVPHHFFEFDFIRVRGGLLDLRHAFSEDWSPVRSHAAFQAFKELIYKMGSDPAFWNLRGHMKTGGTHYDRQFNGNFIQQSEKFLHSFLIGSFVAEWPFERLNDSAIKNLLLKVFQKVGLRKLARKEVLLLDGKEFDLRATEYLENLFTEIVPENCHSVVLNNGFEAFNPTPALDMIKDSKQIVVLRDPRDIYVTGLNAHNVDPIDSYLSYSDNDGLNKSFLASDGLDSFVTRLKLYFDNLPDQKEGRVLFINFEDLVLEYDRSIKLILDFLEMDQKDHISPRTYFDPENTTLGFWKKYSKINDIKYIEDKLSNYLLQD